jgi:hypothetical protein
MEDSINEDLRELVIKIAVGWNCRTLSQRRF